MTTLNKLIQKKSKEFDGKLFTDKEMQSFLSTAIQEGYELGIKECIELTDKSKLPDPNPYGKWVSIKNVNKILTILGGQLQLLLKKESK